MCIGGGGGSKSTRLPTPGPTTPNEPVTEEAQFPYEPPRTTGERPAQTNSAYTGLVIPTGT